MENQQTLFEAFVTQYQHDFLTMIATYEKKAQIIKDPWTRNDQNGYGLSCIIQDGQFFEKAGVNTTKLTIPLSPQMAASMKERPEKAAMIKNIDMQNLQQYSLYANGVSLVIHPINPFIPTVHANFRLLSITHQGILIDQWFGGGCDLTPIYLNSEDATLYHNSLKQACLKADPTNGKSIYDRYKSECDHYFYNKHRKEARGVGGLFFDDFQLNNSFDQGLNFCSQIAYANMNAYREVLEKRHQTPFDQNHVRWREYRRGRYVEFNLVYDRGTKFGLNTPDGRIESILMSLPLIARWEYNFQVEEGSEEDKLVKVLQQPKEWCTI